MIQERINTCYLTIRKNFHVESNVCVLCDDAMPETMEHLIFTCYFSRNFWWKIGEEWNLDLPFMDMLEDAGKNAHIIPF
jgi:hypothetical protein